MNIQTLLGGLLAVQVALAAGMFVRDGSSGSATSEPLLDFAVAAVDRIVIDDNLNMATLTRTDAGWQLADLDGLPANAGKVSTLLDSLDELRTSWPVVQSAVGRERFEVSEAHYQRRLQLYQDATLLGEYYFGTSPGFRQTHARRAGDEAVFAVAFSNFDLPGDSNDWLDKALLSAADPNRIKGPDFEISRTDTEWQLADGDSDSDGVMLNQQAVTELVNAFGSLRVLRADEPAETATPVQFSVGSAAGEWQYEFSSAAGKYHVKRSDHPQGFTISQSDYERITSKSLATLVSNDGDDSHTDSAEDGAGVGQGDGSAMDE